MTTPHLNPVIPGRDQVSAEVLRRMGRAAERQGRLTVGGGLNHINTAGAPVVLDPRPGEILVRIVSGTNPYAWQQIFGDYSIADNTITYRDHDGGLSGTTTSQPLFEVNANQVIQPGTRAFAVLSDDGLCWLITRCCGTTAVMSGSGSGTDDDLIITPSCPNGVPRVLVATLTSDTCACLDGVTITLTYIGGYWTGTASVCGAGQSVGISLQDDGGGQWQGVLACGPGNGGSYNASTFYANNGPGPSDVTCSPFAITGTGVNLASGTLGCCGAGNFPVYIEITA